LPSFEAALAAGADLVEMDCRQSADGVPVVIHDEGVARTTDGRKCWNGARMQVSQRTLAELRGLDAGAWKGAAFSGTRLPTVEEAVDAIRPRAVPLIERKDGDAATLARLIQRRGLEDELIVIAFDWEFLRELRALVPRLVVGALGPPETPRRFQWVGRRNRLNAGALDRIHGLGVGLVVWNNRVDKASVSAAHARGMRVWIYTVNKTAEAARLTSIGVDGLISDDPLLIRQSLGAGATREPERVS
jgi:glycerophosphoryl diester phosphodiesterase